MLSEPVAFLLEVELKTFQKVFLIAIAVEVKEPRGFGRIRPRHVPDVSAESLLGFVAELVERGGNDPDGWPSYSRLGTLGSAHEVTILSASPDPAHVLMPAAHRVASLLKRWLLGTLQGGISKEHLPYYLDEVTFRFNRRSSRARGMLFYRLIEHAVQIEHVSTQDLFKGPAAGAGHRQVARSKYPPLGLLLGSSLLHTTCSGSTLQVSHTACRMASMDGNRDELRRVVARLVDLEPAGRAGFAAKLGVSEATVGRWVHGLSRPQPAIEGKLLDLYRAVSESIVAEPAVGLFGWDNGARDQDVRTIVARTLRDLRECLHRSGRLSSRHEALDELAKLTFAHVMSLDSGGRGISQELATSRNPARALYDFVAGVYADHLPRSLALELQPADFALRLKTSEDSFAVQIVNCFEPLANPAVASQLVGVESVDVLNEVFGQFLADSFVDEKELGQYLTPSEVVRFMTRLGLNSLPDEVLVGFTGPEKCAEFGLILDPSCGVASFLAEALRVLHPEVRAKHGARAASVWLENMMTRVVVGIDKSERMIRLALTNLALFGVPAAQLHLANAIARTGTDAKITDELDGQVRLILTNPPFGAEFPANDLTKYKIATHWMRRNPRSIDSEILFLERYSDWLAPGGVLVAIVPDSILTNRAIYRDLRRGLSGVAEIRSVISLPPVTFGAAGTSTKTSILHAVKRERPPKRSAVFFALCGDLGYEVATRSSQRMKVANGTNELVRILPEACGEVAATVGRKVKVEIATERWDAGYHASLPLPVAQRLEATGHDVMRVRDVAGLSADRADPRRMGASQVFQYIEISDVDSEAYTVRSKAVLCAEAPTRARKRVRAGDVLVSTVRPERKTIAVVPGDLDGAICSTGFAVLRPRSIDPTLLALLLRTDFVTCQILRNNIGIAYPAVDEQCLLDVCLPVAQSHLRRLAPAARSLRERVEELSKIQRDFACQLNALVEDWLNP